MRENANNYLKVVIAMIEICTINMGFQRKWYRQEKKKGFCLVLEWRITPPLASVTLELLYFLNSDLDSGSHHVLESQVFADRFLYVVCIFRRSRGEVGTLVYGNAGSKVM